MPEDNRKKKINKKNLFAHLLPHFLATELLQREIVKSVKKAVIGPLLPTYLCALLNVPFFPSTQMPST